MRVLVSAYACEPGRGSEPGIGWNWARQIARFHEAWVITRANNAPVIYRELERHPMPSVHWVFFDLPRAARFWKKGPRGARLYYYLWQASALAAASRLAGKVGFDLAHHVTFGQYARPSLLAFLKLPFVWGPLGGAEAASSALVSLGGLRARAFEAARRVSRSLGERDPLVRATVRRAAVCLASTEETAVRLRVLGARRVEVHSCCGLPPEDIEVLGGAPYRSELPFRAMSVGRFEHWKGFHLGLQAFAKIQARVSESEYWLFGEGPERRNLERMAQRLDLGGKVRFLGNRPRPEVLGALSECDTLIHPSLHDSGGWACTEAMAAGRPVICLDLGGPALQVTAETGIKVPADNPDSIVAGLADAMLRVAVDRDARRSMGENGRARVNACFAWQRKGEFLNRLYEQIVGQPAPAQSESEKSSELFMQAVR